MITYPSIAGPGYSTIGEQCLAFEKYDGSNLRFFWNPKQGWHQQGTRHKWFNETNPMFGCAVKLFQETYADEIVNTVRRYKEYRNISGLVAYCEFFGPNTFSGLHNESDEKSIVLFDMFVIDRGFVGPKDFVAHFGHLPIAKLIYEGEFSKAFIKDVQDGKFPVHEGIVAKGVHTKKRRKGKSQQEVWFAKVKTRQWMDELLKRSGDSENLQREYETTLREQQLDVDSEVNH